MGGGQYRAGSLEIFDRPPAKRSQYAIPARASPSNVRSWSWAGSFRRTDNNISSYQGIHRVLVLDDRKLEGIVSTMDVARALASGSIR